MVKITEYLEYLCVRLHLKLARLLGTGVLHSVVVLVLLCIPAAFLGLHALNPWGLEEYITFSFMALFFASRCFYLSWLRRLEIFYAIKGKEGFETRLDKLNIKTEEGE